MGGGIHLELHEIGLMGPAKIVGVDVCPEIEADDGTGRNVMTGPMAHPGANILYLDITGLDEPLGVTDTHPIWSETRQELVVAGQLEVGEQFRTLTGESNGTTHLTVTLKYSTRFLVGSATVLKPTQGEMSQHLDLFSF